MNKWPKNAWIYKCNLNYPEKGDGYSYLDPKNGFLANNDGEVHQFGGENWIRSGSAWQRLAQARPGDLIICQQTDRRAVVGITTAASGGYPDPDGEYLDKCSAIDIGPQRVKFDNIVRIADIREHVGNLGAHAAGKSFSTFHDVEPKFVAPLLKLCFKLNPKQKNDCLKLLNTAGSVKATASESTTAACQDPSTILSEPVRREMFVEAFERKQKWAKDARHVYGYQCMVPGCKFELLKEDGELYIEVHHLIPMYLGGSPNDRRNMCVLCPNHHRQIHFGMTERIHDLERRIRQVQSKVLTKLYR